MHASRDSSLKCGRWGTSVLEEPNNNTKSRGTFKAQTRLLIRLIRALSLPLVRPVHLSHEVNSEYRGSPHLVSLLVNLVCLILRIILLRQLRLVLRQHLNPILRYSPCFITRLFCSLLTPQRLLFSQPQSSPYLSLSFLPFVFSLRAPDNVT